MTFPFQHPTSLRPPAPRLGRAHLTADDDAFGARLRRACDACHGAPPSDYGRLAWLVSRVEEETGALVPNECVRRWLIGHARPREGMTRLLASILGVRQAWLARGEGGPVPAWERASRAVAADPLKDGAVAVLAGLVGLRGGTTERPAEDDEVAAEGCVDLYATLRGARYAVHVALPERGRFAVPEAGLASHVVGAVLGDGCGCRFVALDPEGVSAVGRRDGGTVLLPVDHPWREAGLLG